MKKALSMFTVPPGWSVEKCLRLAADTGFEGVELVMGEGDTEISVDVSDQQLRRIRQMADARGVAIASLASALHWDHSFTHGDPAVREKAARIGEAMIRAAHSLETDTVLMIPGYVSPDVYYLDAYRRAVAAMQTLGRVARDSGIHIGLENGGMKFLASPLEFSRFLDEIGSEFVGVYFDTGNAMIEGYPEHWISMLGPRIKKVHLKDFRLSARTFPEAYCHLFEGDVRWPQVMAELRRSGYDSYLVAEFPAPKYFPESVFAAISRNMDLLLSLSAETAAPKTQ